MVRAMQGRGGKFFNVSLSPPRRSPTASHNDPPSRGPWRAPVLGSAPQPPREPPRAADHVSTPRARRPRLQGAQKRRATMVQPGRRPGLTREGRSRGPAGSSTPGPASPAKNEAPRRGQGQGAGGALARPSSLSQRGAAIAAAIAPGARSSRGRGDGRRTGGERPVPFELFAFPKAAYEVGFIALAKD